MVFLPVIRNLWRRVVQSRPEKEASIIRDYFDHGYYLTVYRDVAEAGADPIAHFLNHGWREGRNPNSWFVTEFYLVQNPDIRAAGINPFVHYIRYGRHEGRIPAPRRLDRPAPITTLLSRQVQKPDCPRSDVSIVVPVYNAFDDLTALLSNLEETVADRARVILIDDCSPDERISALLVEWSRRNESWEILRNDCNIGFAASVNRGIEHSAGHVVILNSDILLPRNWLDLLLAPIWEDELSVASVTPFSNNSSLTGFPALRQESDIPPGQDLEDVADAFACLPSVAIDIVSGVGFCMAMSRRALDTIGLIDAGTYRGGYFEDTDWCQRAALAGFRNIAVSNLFVYHKVGSSSYGLERRKRYSEINRQVFLKRFPYYGKSERAFLGHDPLSETRTLAQAILWRQRAPAAVMVIDHAWGGGANVFSDRLRRHMLAEGKFVINLTIMQSIVEVRFSFQSEELKCQETFSSEIWRLADLLQLDEIIVNGVHGANSVVDVLAALVGLSKKSKLIFFVHDYMCVCPSIFLLDGDGAYCGVPDIGACYMCLVSNPNAKFAIANQTEWRRAWGTFLAHAWEIRVFSESSRAILGNAYPALASSPRIVLVEPDDEMECGACAVPTSDSGARIPLLKRRKPGRLRVGVMGSLHLHKGSRVVAELARYIEEQHLPIDITLFGRWHDGKVPHNVEHLGPYKVADIASLVRQKAISVMLFPSVCPETYSYTLSEIFRMNLPTVALRLGAQADRVGQYKWGVLVDQPAPANLCKTLYEADALRHRSRSGARGDLGPECEGAEKNASCPSVTK